MITYSDILKDNYELNDNIKRLRDDFFNTNPSICIERARIITQSYKETEGQPSIIRRAKALEKIITEISINIWDGELLVGNLASVRRGAPVFPEFSVDWIEDELNSKPYRFDQRPGDSYQFTQAVKDELINKIIPYWRGKTHQDRVRMNIPEETWVACEKIKACDDSWLTLSGDGHTIPDYKKVIQVGLKGIIEQAEKRLSEIDLSDPEELQKINFLKSVIIVNKAVAHFAKRYADKAMELANAETNAHRKKELENISKICSNVPFNPATTFQEALQSILFTNIAIQLENNGHSISFGRVDQYLYPYYEEDIKRNNLTIGKAFELLNCLWIKLNEHSKLRDWHNTKFFVGNPLFQNLTIGGQKLNGQDAVNNLSYLCLASTKKLRMIQPSLTVRYFDGISKEFLMECAKVIRLGTGMPALFNDEAIIPSMLKIGYTYEDAKDYGVTGCVEPSPQGQIGGRFGAGFPNFPKMLEIALNDGKDPLTGLQPLKGSGELQNFENFNQIMNEFKHQMDYYLKHHIILENIIDQSWEELTPNPFLSSVIDDCIERGKEIKQGGAKYDFTGGQETGLAACGNSLAALKKVVFDEKLLTLEQVKHALKTNFEDETTNPSGEVVRQILLNKGPKFGNDDDEVDALVSDIMTYWANEKAKYKNTRYGKGPIGGFFIPSTATVASNVPSGEIVGASPDGRKAYEPVSEGISAFRGTDKNGPTALVNSVGKIPNVLMAGGQLLNIKLNPSTLQGEDGLENLISLIKTSFLKKSLHIQFNVVSKEDLIEAQKRPDLYKDLVVRVAGYSSYFIELDENIQNDIIARTEHSFA